MRVIKDIRVYKSNIENIDGNALPVDFADKKLNAIIHRVVMKLRENSFSLGEFDHLYINFTTCTVEGEIALSKRSIDKYHPWYRYYDVNVSDAMFSQLGIQNTSNEVLNLMEKVLVKCFLSEIFDEECIHTYFSEAVTQGEKMLMKYKEKCTSNRKAIVYLRCLDNGNYFPLIRVFDLDGILLLEKDLPVTLDLGCIGDIQLSRNRVSIKPRKNSYTKSLKSISFEY